MYKGAVIVSRLRILAGALMGAVVLLGVGLGVALAGTGATDAPPGWALVALLAAGVVMHVVVTAAGYRAPALDPELPEAAAGADSVQAFQSSMILRLALGESVALAAAALAFVVDAGGLVVYATGAVVSLLLMAYHGWPSERAVERVREQLERGHGRSHVREELGLPPRPGGVIDDLR